MHPVLFHIGAVLIPSYGVLAAIGVLLALAAAQRTARQSGVDPAFVWNLCIVAICAALAGQRLVLIFANWSSLRSHPGWAFALAMVHNPLVTAAGVMAGALAATWYMHSRKLPLARTADTLAAPLALGLAFEQMGALLAGSGFGAAASAALPWAVTYTNPLAARWSGAPLGVPLHPVQAYAAFAFFTLAVFLFLWMPERRQTGDIAGMCLMGLGVSIYITEIWRDPEGRGLILNGALDVPQIVAVLLVIGGGLALRERNKGYRGFPPFRHETGERMGYGEEDRGYPPFRHEAGERMGHGDKEDRGFPPFRHEAGERMGHGNKEDRGFPPFRHEAGERMGHGDKEDRGFPPFRHEAGVKMGHGEEDLGFPPFRHEAGERMGHGNSARGRE